MEKETKITEVNIYSDSLNSKLIGILSKKPFQKIIRSDDIYEKIISRIEISKEEEHKNYRIEKMKIIKEDKETVLIINHPLRIFPKTHSGRIYIEKLEI